jgi:hypothetical protein
MNASSVTICSLLKNAALGITTWLRKPAMNGVCVSAA